MTKGLMTKKLKMTKSMYNAIIKVIVTVGFERR